MKGLKKYGVDITLRESVDNEGDIELTEEENEKKESWQMKTATARPDDNLSGELRRLFNHIPDGGSYLGIPTYMDGNVVFNTLVQLITDSKDSGIMMERLDNYVGLGIDFIDYVQNELMFNDKLKTQLFRIAQKVNINGRVAFETMDDRGNKSTSFISANAGSIKANIINSLGSSFNRSPFVDNELEVKESGLFTDAIDKLDKFRADVKKNKLPLTEDQLKSVISILNTAHIKYNPVVFARLNSDAKSINMFLKNNITLFDILDKGTNPFKGTESNILNTIANSIKDVSNTYITESYRNADNESIQTVVYSSYAAKRFNDLQQNHILDASERKAAKKDAYRSIRESNPYYNNIPLIQDEMIHHAELFEYETLSALRKKGVSKGLGYTSMGENDLMKAYLAAYKNNNKKSKYAYFSMAILADAPVTNMVKLLRRSQEEVIDDLYQISLQEVARIIAIKKDLVNYGKSEIKSLHGNAGLRFHFVDTLTSKDFEREDHEAHVRAKIEKFMTNGFSKFQDYLNESGIELTKDLKDKDFLKDFYFNDFSSRAQLISLTSGDPAAYKNVTDFFKRNKQVNSPGEYIDTNSKFTYSGKLALDKTPMGVKELFKTIFLKDIEKPAKYAKDIFDNLREAHGDHFALTTAAKYGYIPEGSEVNDDSVFSLNGNKYQVSFPSETDAQGYMTLDRWVEIQIGMGEYNNEIHEMVSRVKSGEATSNDISVIMQPVKPFYFGDVIIDGTSRKVQVKNSEYVLLPELANKSKDLKALLSHMEKNKISSANFDTAVKVGEHNVGTYDDLGTATPISLNNSDYRVQMATPAHYANATTLIGTQIRKLISADISSDDKFGDMSGTQMIDHIDAILGKTVTEAFDELIGELADKNKLLDRDLGDRYVSMLEIDENGDPKVDFHHPALSRISQNVINSIFKKAVAKTKTKGSQLYNLSSFGFSEKLSIKFNDKKGIDHIECMIPAQALFGKSIPVQFLDENGQTDITKVPDELLTLIGYRIPTEDKYSMFNLKVKGFLPNNGAIMLPNGATTQAGLDFDIDKIFTMNYAYENVSPVLDEEEGFEAYLNTDVSKTDKPFLRRSHKKFDMTKGKKAYANRKGIWYNAESDTFHSEKELRKVPSSMDSKLGRDNMLLDAFRTVLSAPSSTKSTLSPGGYDVFKKATYIIQALQDSKNSLSYATLNKMSISEIKDILSEESLNVANILTNKEIFGRNMAGKNLTAISANHNSAHALIQHGDVKITKGVFNFDAKGRNSISEQLDVNGNSITKAISEILAAVVDNANDPLAGYVNLSAYTSDVVFAMLHNGVPIETALAFINQPIIKKFATLRKNFGNNRQAETKALQSLDVMPVHRFKVTNEYSTESLLGNIGGKQMDKAILSDFLSMKLVSGDVAKLVNAVKSGDAGSGPTQGHNEYTIYKHDVVLKSNYLFGHKALLTDNTKSSVTYYQQGIVKANRAINDVMKYPYQQPIYTRIKDKLNEEIAEDFLTTDDRNKINDDLMSYAASNSLFFNKAELDKLHKSLPNRFEKFKASEEGKKYGNLLNLMEVAPLKKGSTKFAISYNTVVTSKEQQNLSYNSWLSMYTHGSETARTMAIDLFKYSFAKSGFGFGKGTFNNIAPIELYDSITNGEDNFKQMMEKSLEEFNGNSITHTNRFVEQYIKNNWDKLNFIPNFTANDYISVEKDDKFISINPDLHNNFKKRNGDVSHAFEFIRNSSKGLFKLVDSKVMSYELIETEEGRTVYDSTEDYQYSTPANEVTTEDTSLREQYDKDETDSISDPLDSRNDLEDSINLLV
jgi:hypothetical protein